MIDNDVIKQIAELFNGDSNHELFNYKTGPSLISFFNSYFGYSDSYGNGFPSRWMYTFDKLIELIQEQRIDEFFDLILSKRYLMKEKKINQIEAIVLADTIFNEINNYLIGEAYQLIKIGEHYKLVDEDNDLEFINEGGFAKVYIQKSTGEVIKKLKEEYLTNDSIKSRFKREFEITKSLSGISGVIKVYNFNSSDYSYTMEQAQSNLADEIYENEYNYDQKRSVIMQILDIMAIIHRTNIIHRDLSPKNILLVNNDLKIADFGLGKNLDKIHSHETIATNNYGQYYYCAPEQIHNLGKGDKRSDVYSLGRIINFIMTKHPMTTEHSLISVVDKAVRNDPNDRQQDAAELKISIERLFNYIEDEDSERRIMEKITKNKLDEEVKEYIYTLNGDKLCEMLVQNKSFYNILSKFLENTKERRIRILNLIDESYMEYCGNNWDDYDVFMRLTTQVISSKDYAYLEKEKSAKILYSIAYEKNRFNAQDSIKRLIREGVEPAIEDILR